MSISIFVESIQRLFDPPDIVGERLFLVSFLGFLVNLVGIFAFDHGHVHHHAHSHHAHNHDDGHECTHDHHETSSWRGNLLLEGVFLHIMADLLGSLGVIISSILIEYIGWLYADPICSLCISLMIFFSILPLLKRSAFSLMQYTPDSAFERLERFRQQVIISLRLSEQQTVNE